MKKAVRRHRSPLSSSGFYPGGRALFLPSIERAASTGARRRGFGGDRGFANLSTLKELWLNDRSEFVVAMAAFAGVLTFGLLRGVMLGALISLVQLVRVSSRPHVALLGRIPGTRRFSDCDRHADNELIPNVMIFRPESALVYFNVDNVCEAILSRVRVEATSPKLVVLDLSAAPLVDMQSAHTLASTADELSAIGIRFQAVSRAPPCATGSGVKPLTPNWAA